MSDLECSTMTSLHPLHDLRSEVMSPGTHTWRLGFSSECVCLRESEGVKVREGESERGGVCVREKD